MTNFIFDGNGLFSEFTKLEKHWRNKKSYYCFWIPLSHEKAKKYGVFDNTNYDPELDEYEEGRLILTVPEIIDGHKNIYELKNQPDSQIFLIETSWKQEGETEFHQRRKIAKEKIKEKKEQIEKLKIINKNRKTEFFKLMRDKTKEINLLKNLVGESAPLEEGF